MSSSPEQGSQTRRSPSPVGGGAFSSRTKDQVNIGFVRTARQSEQSFFFAWSWAVNARQTLYMEKEMREYFSKP